MPIKVGHEAPSIQDEIFVPICYSEYSTEYLKKSELEELEKYVWFFTKEWPLIYDVYDKNNNLSVNITGDTYVYEHIKSPYSIKLENRDAAIKFYKLLKVLFILQTEIPHYYNFELKLNDIGNIEFYFNGEKIAYENSSDFIKNEYIKIEKQKKNFIKDKSKLEKKLKKIKEELGILDLEYLSKEKEITLYLECRKTFFGKVKYFFGKKKRTVGVAAHSYPGTSGQMPLQNNTDNDAVRDLSKEFYTLEELIERYKLLEKESNYVKNIKLDINAAELRIKNMKLKIKNASLYLEEIDSHAKSIFEFWKYANKDKIDELAEGEEEEESAAKLKKTFDYVLDFENFAKDLDRRERDFLSKDEINSIYMAGTEIISDLNTVAEGNVITEDRIKKLKEEIIKEKMLLGNEKFDIFGSVSSDKTRINILANKRHREIRRDKIKLLDITRNTEAAEYEEYLKKALNNIHSSLEKISLKTEIPIYKTGELDSHLNIFNINPSNLIDENSTTLYRLNLKENTSATGFTNIVYYDNSNQTLPLGMDVSQSILIDKSLLELKLTEKRNIKIIYYKDGDELSDIIVKTINIQEYDV